MRKSFFFVLIVVFAGMSSLLAQDDSSDDVVFFRESAPDTSQFELETVATGFNRPLYVTAAGDGTGRLFLVEQAGRIWILQDGEVLDTPFLNLSDVVSQDVLRGYSERGLLGLAFHPDYEETGLFYVNYTDNSGGTSHVVEYSVSPDDPNVADPGSARPLLLQGQPFANHNGGHMDFGPDGYLYISLGDGGSRDDPRNNGQDPSTWLGAILRIDVDNFGGENAYGIPEDNPVSFNENLAPEVWAWGYRNVWRFSFDRATGDLYTADVGQNQWEEINFEPADSEGGLNYGWPAYESDQRYIGSEPSTEVVMPIATYDHSDGCSVTGGYVYRGEAIPELQGAYLYSDYCSGTLWAAYRNPDGAWQSQEIMETGVQVSSFGEDEDGELYIVNYGGSVMKFVPTG